MTPASWAVAKPQTIAITMKAGATIAGSANPNNIRKWAEWAAEPIDRELLKEVQAIFEPVKNIGHTEGLPENN